jgi:dihydroneopterin aldolase
MDTIFLNGLKLDAVIGLWDWEKRIKQTIEIDLEMAVDIRRAAETDNVEDTLNYKAVANGIKELVESTQFELVETLIERIASLIMTEFGVPWVRVRVNKPGAIRGSRDVGVLIERGRRVSDD